MLPSSWKDRAAYIDHLRAEWAAMEYKYKGNTAPLQVETLRFLQKETDKAYEDAMNKLSSGRLTPRLSSEEAVGNYVDLAVRKKLREFYNTHYVDFGSGQVRVQGRDYDTSGTDRTFRIPDARVGDVAFDVTLTPKGVGTPQIRGFFNTDARPRAVVIVRPSQLGRNSTYMITRPTGGGSL